MQRLIPRSILILVVLLVSGWAFNPPKEKLRLGKDLAGGASLVYAVQLKAGDVADEVVPQVIDVLKKRVDPDGLAEISIIRQGRDRIEITMPLPGPEVKALRRTFDEELAKLDRAVISGPRFDSIMAMPAQEREAQLKSFAGGDSARASLFSAASAAYDVFALKREAVQKAQAAGVAQAEIDKLVDEAAEAAIGYDKARDAAVRGGVSSNALRRALQLSSAEQVLSKKATKERVTIPSPRQRAIDKLIADHPEAKTEIERVIEAYKQFTAKRRGLDDPNDLVKQLRGAGVLTFRIAVRADYDPAEVARLRRELAEKGPRNVRAQDVRWFKINQPKTWYDSIEAFELMTSNPAGFFATYGGSGFVGAEYQGDYYLLCYDQRSSRLTQAEGNWSVARSFPSRDTIGRSAIGFEMDPRGSVLLGQLTGNHVNENMAVLLDDEVYTAPRLNSQISSSGIIEGDFSQEELSYIIRVLGAGSLQAKLSPEPLSIQSLGPELGADNLRMGLRAGWISLLFVIGFMVIYYFRCGVIACIALAANSIIIMGAMALQKAAFTMPGIAGMILTFGMAVDSNVLIYERMREEILRGADLKTAVRLGFDKAFNSILDGNVTNLIVCVILAQFGTQEIRGFGIAMGIGVVATLFAAIVVSRVLFDALIYFGLWKQASMLPLAIPALQRALEPNVRWIRLRYVFFTISAAYVSLGLYMTFARGERMLDIEFRGGTQATLQFKPDPADPSRRVTLLRRDVEDRVVKIGAEAPEGTPLRQLAAAEVVPINPQADGVTSDKFAIKTVADDPAGIQGALAAAFADVLEARPPVAFGDSERADFRTAPVFRVNYPRLGENIERADIREDVSQFVGGLAIVLADIEPPQTLDSLRARLSSTRATPEFSDTGSRRTDVIVIGGTDERVTAAVVLVRDESLSFVDSETRFDTEVAEREWSLVREALTKASTPASVESFSAAIAETFKTKAIQATIISFLLIAIYLWVRFRSFRFSIAALVALVHDVLTVVGLVALCQILYENKSTHGFVAQIGILPFKIDLNLMAALLTIAGYSLNDTIVIMDRIRETRGKLPYVTRDMIDTAVNQTLSRTVITGGTTLLSLIVLYMVGGEGMRAFAFALLTGLIIGTYSSVAVAAPIVWSRKESAGTESA